RSGGDRLQHRMQVGSTDRAGGGKGRAGEDQSVAACPRIWSALSHQAVADAGTNSNIDPWVIASSGAEARLRPGRHPYVGIDKGGGQGAEGTPYRQTAPGDALFAGNFPLGVHQLSHAYADPGWG